MTARLLAVGAGPTGTTVFYQLTRALIDAGKTSSLEIVLTDADRPGPGMAFGTCNSRHLLNVDAKLMSVDPGNPKHFVQWCRENTQAWRGRYPRLNLETDGHPPRYLFGMYLQAVLRSTAKLAASHAIRTDQRRDQVVSIRPAGLRLAVGFESGARELFDHVVLATGHQLPDTYQELADSPAYSTTPTDLSGFPLDREPMSIIGTRLSAIDAVLELVNLGYTGPIRMVSRSGWLPKVACPTGSCTLRYPTKDFIATARPGTVSLDAFMSLFQREIEHAQDRRIDWAAALAPPPSCARTFRHEIEVASARAERPWEAVLITLYDAAPWLWRTLTENAKLRFRREYYSIWMTYLGSVPLVTARRIQALLDSGQLTVHGGLRSISYDAGASAYVLQLDRAPYQMLVRAVVNATGPGLEVTRSRSPLLTDLLASALAAPHPCGGVRVGTDDFRLRTPDGTQVHPGLFALGDLTHGDWLATADVGHIAAQANILVRTLLNRGTASAPT